MVKHTQTIRRQFDNFMKLALKGLRQAGQLKLHFNMLEKQQF